MVVVLALAVVIVPIQVWAEESQQWDQTTPWQKQDDGKIPVLIMWDAPVQPSKIDGVLDVITSKNTVDSDNMSFIGWNQGIEYLNSKNNTNIPILDISGDISNRDYIIVYLTDDPHSRYDGFTKLTYNENKIKSAFVTIYDADELTKQQIETITRHELGHALGLSHTSKKNDLMNPIIDMKYNLISLVDLAFLLKVY